MMIRVVLDKLFEPRQRFIRHGRKFQCDIFHLFKIKVASFRRMRACDLPGDFG